MMERNTGLQEVVISSFQEMPRFNLEDWIYNEIEAILFLSEYIGGETAIHIPGDYNGRQVVIPSLSIFPINMTDLFIEEVNGKKLKTIKNFFFRVFEGNKNIITLDLRGLDTSQVTNMSRMFSNSQVKEVDVSKWDTSQVTNMKGMFSNSQVKEVDVSKWDTSRVEDMSEMFKDSQVKELALSKWDTSRVEDMSEMFKDSQVKELTISKWDTSKVISMRRMFKGCQVKELDVRDWNTSQLRDMREIFSDSQVKETDISNWDISHLEDFDLLNSFDDEFGMDLFDFEEMDKSLDKLLDEFDESEF